MPQSNLGEKKNSSRYLTPEYGVCFWNAWLLTYKAMGTFSVFYLWWCETNDKYWNIKKTTTIDFFKSGISVQVLTKWFKYEILNLLTY